MLSRQDLMTLEAYAAVRADFRRRAREHRRARQVALGDHVMLCFEDRDTVHYQIQEMLYIERHFEPQDIQDELDAYVPLIPTGTNFKATMMIEYPVPAVRDRQLRELVGIENRVYVQVEGSERVYAKADEDLGRTNADKTSAVHFLSFELPDADRRALRAGAVLSLGVDHVKYVHHISELPDPAKNQLIKDLRD
jgi:hypothetical protein